MRRRRIAPWVLGGLGLACSEPSPSLPPLPPETTTTAATPGSDSTTAATTGGSADEADSTGPPPDGPGVCATRCRSRFDCAADEEEADGWECTHGFCREVVLVGCDPFECEILGGGVCSAVDGLDLCTVQCLAGGSQCPPLEDCLGTDDLGFPICAPIPCQGVAEGEPCTTPTGQATGTCIAGQCTCTVDEECTVVDQACARG